MSVAGILDAMRANVHPSIRIVWQCLENHANGARWWRMTERAMATELHLSRKTVERAVIALEGKGDDAVRPAVVAVKRCKRRPATFTMLRTYPEGRSKPRHEPEVERRIEPELTRQNDDSTAELTRQNDDSLFPPVQNPPEGEEDAREGAPCLPVKADFNVEEEDAANRAPFPDEDPVLTLVEAAEIRAAGHDPAELPEEVRDWARREGATSSKWPYVMVKWAKKTPPKRLGAAKQHRKPRVDHDASAKAILAGLRASIAAGALVA